MQSAHRLLRAAAIVATLASVSASAPGAVAGSGNGNGNGNVGNNNGNGNSGNGQGNCNIGNDNGDGGHRADDGAGRSRTETAESGATAANVDPGYCLHWLIGRAPGTACSQASLPRVPPDGWCTILSWPGAAEMVPTH